MSPLKPEAPEIIQILLVDDHPVVRAGVRLLLEQECDIKVCAEAADAESALAVAATAAPDLAIIDISLPGEDGLSLVRRLRNALPSIRMLILSMNNEDHFAGRAIRAGASGYVMKEAAADTIVAAIRTVLRGQVYVSDALQPRLGEFLG